MDGYSVRMNNTLRKDGKKDCCFEISAPDKRIYQFTAASPKDAEEWVQQLQFVLQDMGSDVIPEEEDERGELYDDVDHPLPVGSSRHAASQPMTKFMKSCQRRKRKVIRRRRRDRGR